MALSPAIPARVALAQEKAERATRGLPSPKIKDVSVIATQPGGSRLVVVKISTDQDGLFGYGCATFKDGYLWASDAPGWGIEVDEKLAKTFPFRKGGLNGGWGDVRRLDGTVIKQ